MTEEEKPIRRRRRLAAILMADIAGFSRLMGRDEEGTTSRVLEFHERVRATVEEHGGRVVATAGDSVFGDFDSVVDALECAAAVQRDLHTANESLPPDQRIDARMGLHLGDVIVEEYNVFGDGVNVAARLEQLADPGGIVISEAVFQQVKGKSNLPIVEMGTKSLKNIEDPIRVYRIAPEAFGGSTEDPADVDRSPPAVRSRRNEAFKARIRERIEQRIEESIDKADLVDASRGDEVVIVRRAHRKRGAAAVFTTGALVPLTIGVLLVLARTSGWSENGWYPFLGCILIGLSVGAIVQGASGRRGFQPLMVGIGLAVGASFMEGTVTKAVLWVIAVGIGGGGLRALTVGPKPDRDG